MIFTKPDRRIGRIFIHCSDSDVASHDNIETIREWHLKRGWLDVGYHFFIKKNGAIKKGRDLEIISSAQQNHNLGTISICLSGRSKALFTQDQFNSLVEFCQQINSVYDGKVTFHGHCEVSDKTCPVFDYKGVLDLDEKGHLNQGGC